MLRFWAWDAFIIIGFERYDRERLGQPGPGAVGCVMPFKPNYNQQRAERNRLKQAKKEAKVRERADAAARRKIEQGSEQMPGRTRRRSAGQPQAGDEPQAS